MMIGSQETLTEQPQHLSDFGLTTDLSASPHPSHRPWPSRPAQPFSAASGPASTAAHLLGTPKGIIAQRSARFVAILDVFEATAFMLDSPLVSPGSLASHPRPQR